LDHSNPRHHFPCCGPHVFSERKATIGLTFAARNAGSRHAINPTTSTTTAAKENIIVTPLPITFGLGYVFWRSRSILPSVILPSVILHGAVNVPTKEIYDFILPATMVAVLILFRRSWWKEVQAFCLELEGKGWKIPALGGTLFVVAMTIGFEAKSAVFVPLAFFCLGVALIVEFRHRRPRTSLPPQ
jgi:hypothetical protein